MFTWISKASAPAGVGAPTPLLGHLAGDFAARIAGLWPAPHAVFLTAGADRRHLICLALAGADLPVDLADGLLHWPLRRAIKVALPDAPDGLARALGVMGETAWSGEDYQRLVRLLREPEPAKRLRHAGAVTPALVSALALTPAPLLRAGIARLNLAASAMEPVREAWTIVAAREPPSRLAAIAARWGGAADPGKLRTAIEEDLIPPLPAWPLPASPMLRPLASAAAMREAGVRFRNCVGGQVDTAADGEACYLEWLGEPGAVVEVKRDLLRGWVFAQAKLAGNETVPEAQREPILAALRGIGVHIGRPSWALERALNAGLLYAQEPYAADAFVADCFVD